MQHGSSPGPDREVSTVLSGLLLHVDPEDRNCLAPVAVIFRSRHQPNLNFPSAEAIYCADG